MFIFKCSATHFILVSLFGLLSFASEADPVFGDSACTVGAYFQLNSEFQYNLNSLLNSLASNASHHDFYRIPGDKGNPDFVSGLFLCRGDVTPTSCQECVTAAAIEITRGCPNQAESIIWYDECMLHYSNFSFMNNIVPSMCLNDDKNVSDSDRDRFSQLLSSTLNELAEKAANSSSKKKFATKEAEFTRSQKLYSLAQCVPDLSTFDCMMCFQSAISSVPTCEGKQLKQGARALLPGCNVRYELYPFYNISALSTQSEHPPPSSVSSHQPSQPLASTRSTQTDFGMAKMVAIDETQGSTNRIVGTFGYMSPEYAMLGQFSEKSDVFSFGVMILEIISGKKNANSCESQHADGLLSYAWKRLRDENPLELLDPNLTEVCPHIEVIKCIQIGLLCVQENPDARPPMATVVSYLSNHSIQLPFPQEPAFFLHGRIGPTIEATESSLVQYANNTLPTSINDVSLSTFFPR